MMRRVGWRQLFCTAAIAVLASVPGRAQGAEFDLLDDQSTTQETPNDNTPPCETFADAQAGTSDMGGIARAEGGVLAEALGQIDGCNVTANAVANGKGVFELVPTMGESDGDPVTVCALLNLQTTLDAQNSNSTASVKFHQSSVVVTDSGTLQLAQPPRAHSVVDAGKKVGFRCQREFTLRIGERISTNVGATATAKVDGIGQSTSAATAHLDVLPGSCVEDLITCGIVTPSPSISHVGLSILALGLVSFGALLARRRQGHRA